jgi:hypothetical protein
VGGGDRLSSLCQKPQQIVDAIVNFSNRMEASKPPSSDIVKPPKPPAKGKWQRKQGAQPGRPLPFYLEEIDKTWDYHLTVCPDCGGRAESSDELPRIIHQVEIIACPIEIS